MFNFVATNANDGNVTSYWESNGFPSTLTVKLGADADVTGIVVKLNPDPAWGPRTQNFEVLGRAGTATGFSALKGRADYAFSPSGNPGLPAFTSAVESWSCLPGPSVPSSFTGNAIQIALSGSELAT